MIRAHAITPHPRSELRFGFHRTALVEAAVDAAWAAAWLLLWLAFLVTLAQPRLPHGAAAGPGTEAGEMTRGTSAQPDPGPSSRGVAPPVPTGAG